MGSAGSLAQDEDEYEKENQNAKSPQIKASLPPGGAVSPSGMQIEKSTADGATTLKLAGEIDLHASPALRAELQACAAARTPVLLVDFSGVEYIDSSGLATFIEYVRAAAAFKGRIALFGLKKKVRTIFDLVRLNELFTITDSAEAAAAALAAK